MTGTDDPAFVTMTVPGLTAVGTLKLERVGLTSIDWPGVDVGLVDVWKNPALASVTIGSTDAGTYGVWVKLEQNPVLASVRFPRLVRADQFTVKVVPMLTTLSAPVLARARALGLIEATRLVAPEFPALKTVTNHLYLYRDHALTNLDWLSSVTVNGVEYVTIQQNNALTSLMGLSHIVAQPNYYAIGGLTITGNTALTTAQINAFIAALAAINPVGAYHFSLISGNAP